MFPKTVLTVIGGNQSLDTVRKTISFCGDNNSHLSVTVIGIAPPPPTSVYAVVPMEAWTEERNEGQTAVKAQAERIDEALASSGISGDVTSYFCEEREVSRVVGMRARYADLALVQKADDAEQILFDETLQGLLFESAKPFLVVPQGSAPMLKARKVMVAWNASKEAARTVHLALDLIAAADAVHIAMVDPVAREYDQGEEPGGDIAAYLARHGAKVTVDVLSGTSRDPADVLLRHASDTGAGLIVAGAYGHSRLREYLFGGTTREFLRNAKLPVFLAH